MVTLLVNKMSEKTISLIVKISSFVVISLIIVFGVIINWIGSYESKNYFEQYKKYDSVKIGMNQEQVQAIMKVRPLEVSVDKFHYPKEFNQVFVYPIALAGVDLSAVADVTVFYLNGEVVGKDASVLEIPIFGTEEVNAMKSSSLRPILIMAVGIVGAILWLVIFPRYHIIKQNSYKNFWIDILLGLSFITSVGIVILLGMATLGGIIGVLFLKFNKIFM